MNWKIAICDDEKVFNEKIYQLCAERLEQEKIDGEFYRFEDGEKLIASNEEFHVIFLDVEMEGMDGFEVAKKLMYQGCQAKIIYITSHDEWVQRAFEVRAYRYLYKTQMDSIPDVMMDAIGDLSQNQNLIIKARGEDNHKVILRFDDIYAIESIGDDTAVMLIDGNIITRESVKSIIQRMNENFVIFNRGKAVNLEHIKKINKGQILLENGMNYQISIRNERKVRKAFDRFIKRQLRYQ